MVDCFFETRYKLIEENRVSTAIVGEWMQDELFAGYVRRHRHESSDCEDFNEWRNHEGRSTVKNQ
ncbi:hypothetical protein ABIE91_000830 [Bradyrhizobium elkanii]